MKSQIMSSTELHRQLLQKSAAQEKKVKRPAKKTTTKETKRKKDRKTAVEEFDSNSTTPSSIEIDHGNNSFDISLDLGNPNNDELPQSSPTAAPDEN